MGVYIEGMEMPKKGSWVSLRVFPEGQCFLYSWCGNDFDFMEHLTAAPVPPHGRLIDKDALLAQFSEMSVDDYSLAEYLTDHGVFDTIDNMPTIIQAEGET